MNRENVELTTKYLEFEKMFPPFLRDAKTMLCIPDIAKGWEWCFNPEEAYVLEKVDGTNVKVEVNGLELSIFARNQKHKGYFQTSFNDPQYKYINQGVVNYVAGRKKKMKDGIYYGELLGPAVQGNPYKLDTHRWFTFEPHKDGVQVYKDYPQTSNFEEWKNWILQLSSLLNPEVEAEGIVFLHRKDGRMAKLRKDMFSTTYKHQ